MIDEAPNSSSWIFKGILKCRPLTHHNPCWTSLMQLPKFKTGLLYRHLKDTGNTAPWKTILYKNVSRPRAQMLLWLACHERLATRERLHRFGLIDTEVCCFCPLQESQQHLLFSCPTTSTIWQRVLAWLKVQHTPQN